MQTICMFLGEWVLQSYHNTVCMSGWASLWIVHDLVCIMTVNISRGVQSSIIASTVWMECIKDLRPALCTSKQWGNVQGHRPTSLSKRCDFHVALNDKQPSPFIHKSFIDTCIMHVPATPGKEMERLNKKKSGLKANQWKLYVQADLSTIVSVLYPYWLGRQTQEMVCVLSRHRDSPRPREGETAPPPSSENEIDVFCLLKKL